MNRRAMVKSLFGAPIAAAAGVSVVSSSSVTEVVVLQSDAVRVDLRIYDRAGGRFFNLTLLDKPWPRVGDRVRFDYQALHLLGVVEFTEVEPRCQGSSSCFCHVFGLVLEFSS